jgi:hypothetical protein
MLIDYFNGCVRACSLSIAAQVKTMGNFCLYFQVYGLVSVSGCLQRSTTLCIEERRMWRSQWFARFFYALFCNSWSQLVYLYHILFVTININIYGMIEKKRSASTTCLKLCGNGRGFVNMSAIWSFEGWFQIVYVPLYLETSICFVWRWNTGFGDRYVVSIPSHHNSGWAGSGACEPAQCKVVVGELPLRHLGYSPDHVVKIGKLGEIRDLKPTFPLRGGVVDKR